MSSFIKVLGQQASRYVGLLILIMAGLTERAAIAEVTADQTLSPDEVTVVTPNRRGTYQITGGALRNNDSFLFHSFEQFSLSSRERAFFDHPNSVDTIWARVIGKNGLLEQSFIDGEIFTDFASTADIFLLNPKGIVFGTNAQLNIGGSFFATTAESVTFANGDIFGTNSLQPVSLTISQPLGLSLGDSSESIDSEASLGVASGETIAFVGNGITLSGGQLFSESGRVEIASIASASSLGLVPPEETLNGTAWALDYSQNIENIVFQDIQLVSDSLLDTTSDLDDNPNGSIEIRGNNFLLAESEIANLNFGATTGGDVTIVTSGNITLSTGAAIDTSTFAVGNGGDLRLESLEDIEIIEESRLVSQSEVNGAGASGNITINAANFSVRDGSDISTATFSNRNGGKLLINTLNGTTEVIGVSEFDDSLVSFLAATTQSGGDGGEIQINTRSLLVSDGGQILVGTFGRGNGGRLLVNASESVTVIGEVNNSPSQISSSTGDPLAADPAAITGNAGTIDIDTERLTVSDGGTIFTSTDGAGNGGDLAIRSENVLLSGEGSRPSGLFARTEGAGDSGRITVTATDTLSVQSGARITVSTDEDALSEDEISAVPTPTNIGTVKDAEITARVLLLNNGEITAESLSSDGGNITLNVQDSLLLQNNSLISAAAGTANLGGSGGNVTINSPRGFVIAVPNSNSDIAANAFSGSGGNINITTQSILGLEARSSTTNNTTNDISASSQFGSSGTITLNNLDVDPTQGLIELPANTTAPNQVAQRCLADGDSLNAFIVTGQGGASPAPRDIVRNETSGLVDLGDRTTTAATTPSASTSSILSNDPETITEAPIVEAKGWHRTANGGVTLVAATPAAQVPNNTYLDCDRTARR